jgi:hypothetical protein
MGPYTPVLSKDICGADSRETLLARHHEFSCLDTAALLMKPALCRGTICEIRLSWPACYIYGGRSFYPFMDD